MLMSAHECSRVLTGLSADMPPRATPRKAARDKRPAPDDAESSPAKRKKQADDDSEVFTLSPEEQVKQLVLPGRNTFESCDK